MHDENNPKKMQDAREGHAMSFAEIAIAMGITRQRATQLFQRALRKANKTLAKRGYKLEDFING